MHTCHKRLHMQYDKNGQGSILTIREKTEDNVYICKKQESLCICIILSDNIHLQLYTVSKKQNAQKMKSDLQLHNCQYAL